MFSFLTKKTTAMLITAVFFSAICMGASDTELPLRMMQCIEAALTGNRDIMIERMNLREAEGEVVRAWSTFDPIATADTVYAHVEQPAGSQLLGADVAEQENVTWNFGLQSLVPTGALLRLDFQNERSESNSNFQQLNPQYSTSVVFSATQPLLRGAGFGPNLYRVKIAKNNLAVSEIALQELVLATVSQVEQAYWNLVLARENLKVNNLGKELALETLWMTQAQVRTGVLPPVATLQAEATAAAREEGVILAENSVDTAQRELLRIINAYEIEKKTTIVPLDTPAPIQPLPDFEKLREDAMRNNFQLKQLEYQLKTATISRRVARNTILPRLDIVGSVGLNGIAGDAGEPLSQTVETGRVIPDPTGLSLGILETTTITSPPSEFDGDYYDALDTMFGGDYLQWTIGLQMSYPLGNRGARREYSRAIIEEQKSIVQFEKARDIVRTQIENLIGNLETSVKRVEATAKSAALAEKNMRTEEKKFKVGISTNRDVLEAQEAYSMALSSQNRALIDYNKNRGKIERARMGYIDMALPSQITAISAQTYSPSAATTSLTGQGISGAASGSSSIPGKLSPSIIP